MEHGRLDGYARDLIRIKARELVNTTEVPESEIEDVEQDLKLDLMRRLRHYDSQRGSLATFYRIVVDRRIASILARRASPTKNPGAPILSLDDTIQLSYGTEIPVTDTLEADRGQRPDLADLRLDMDQVRKRLPAKLRKLCKMLPENTVAEIAEAFGVDRRTITRWKAELQERFRSAGLDDYL